MSRLFIFFFLGVLVVALFIIRFSHKLPSTNENTRQLRKKLNPSLPVLIVDATINTTHKTSIKKTITKISTSKTPTTKKSTQKKTTTKKVILKKVIKKVHKNITPVTTMIPKIIHQYWNGKNRPVSLMEECRSMHPDWEYNLWTPENIHKIKNFKNKKIFHAFSKQQVNGQSDILRFEVLNEFGGIYLDADTYCFRSLDELRKNGFFAGYHDHGNNNIKQVDHGFGHLIASAVIGSVKNHPLSKRLVDFLENNPSHAYKPAWRAVGPGHLTRMINSCNICNATGDVKIYPFYAFVPYQHGEIKTIEKYIDNLQNLPKVKAHNSYCMNLWGTTFNSWNKLKNIKKKIVHKQEFSVGIKTLNRPAFTVAQIKSILKYYPSVTIHVADDGRENQVEAYTTFKDNVIYHKLAFDYGISASRNYLVNSMKSDYVVIIDDDMIWTKNTKITLGIKRLKEEKKSLLTASIEGKESFSGRLYQENGVTHRCKLDYGVKKCIDSDVGLNIIIARRIFLKSHPWPDKLKIGEHIQFFVDIKRRAANSIISCKDITVVNSHAWSKSTKSEYDRLRNRAYKFMEQSIGKLQHHYTFDSTCTRLQKGTIVKNGKYEACLENVKKNMPIGKDGNMYAHHWDSGQHEKWNEKQRWNPMKLTLPCKIWYVGANTQGADGVRLQRDYSCTIDVFEPVPEFFNVLKRNWRKIERSTLHNYGLGARSRIVKGVSLHGQSTFAMESSGGGKVSGELKIRNVFDVWKDLGSPHIDLLHVNCEGCEWELWETMLHYNIIDHIDIVQFGTHWFKAIKNIQSRYCNIHANMSKTHDVAFSQAFGWERWTRRKRQLQQLKKDKPTCAVVFSSGSLLKHNYGKEIDKYENVYRFNLIKTKGYEKHVGSKTTHQIFWNKYTQEFLSNKLYENITGVSYAWPTPIVKNYRNFQQKVKKNRKWIMPRKKDYVKLCNKLLGFDSTNQWCTTGMLTLLYLKDVCSEVHLFGSKHDPCLPHHYDYPVIKPCKEKTLNKALSQYTTHHDLERERTFLSKSLKTIKIH